MQNMPVIGRNERIEIKPDAVFQPNPVYARNQKGLRLINFAMI